MAKVLLVDDDAPALELRKLILERQGHEVSVATDATKARALFSELHPTHIVLDLRLPDLADGLSLIRAFRTASPNVRIIALCGWPPDLEGTPESQMVNMVLTKPIRTAALVSALLEVGRTSPSAPDLRSGTP
jgi:two-component system response regulator RegA